MVLSTLPAKTAGELHSVFSSPPWSAMLNPLSTSDVRALLPVVLALSMVSSSCWFRKAPPLFTPPPPQAQPQASAPIETPTLPAPPKIEGDPSATLPPVTSTLPEAPEPAKPKPPPRRGSIVNSPPKATTPPAQTPDQPVPPRLGQI